MISNAQLSKKLGFRPNFFAELKSYARAKYDFIFSFHSDNEKSVQMYSDFIIDLFNDMLKISQSFTNSKSLSIWLAEIGAYSDNLTGASSLNGAIYKYRESEFKIQTNLMFKLIKIREKHEHKSISHSHRKR